MKPHAVDVRPQPTQPPTVVSDEAEPHHHAMSQAQGDAYLTALKHMAEKVADRGMEAPVGQMIVAVAIEEAEGMYEMEDGTLRWMEPSEQNYHIEVSARDAADNRFIPGLEVSVRVVQEDVMVFESALPMLWHPWLYHYGANATLPTDSPLAVEVEIAALQIPRHDEKNGIRHTDDLFVRFEGIELPPVRGS